MDINWDDEELAAPAAFDDDNDLVQFSTSLRISDDEEDEVTEQLPALPEGVQDASGDRGVLIKRKRTAGPSGKRPSKEEPFVEVHYEGFLVASGDKFDSSREQNYAMIVQLDIPPSGKSTVIRGWEIALRELRVGEIAEVTVASRYAYGKDGSPPDIPKDADLRFEIEVLDIRATHKRTVQVDHTKQDLSRLEEIRRDREIAQQRRAEESAQKDEEKKIKADRVAALREKLANKNKKGGKKGGKKKK